MRERCLWIVMDSTTIDQYKRKNIHRMDRIWACVHRSIKWNVAAAACGFTLNVSCAQSDSANCDKAMICFFIHSVLWHLQTVSSIRNVDFLRSNRAPPPPITLQMMCERDREENGTQKRFSRYFLTLNGFIWHFYCSLNSCGCRSFGAVHFWTYI